MIRLIRLFTSHSFICEFTIYCEVLFYEVSGEQRIMSKCSLGKTRKLEDTESTIVGFYYSLKINQN